MESKRYAVIDGIRGLALLNMVVYHAIWDIVYIFHFDWSWYQSEAAYIWQQSICWTFIFLSGFCQPLGRRRLKRGLCVFAAGVLITAVTAVATPQNRILFGVLTLIGSCMLLMIPLNAVFEKCHAGLGFAFSMALFILTRNVNDGYLGFEHWNLLKLPEGLYRNLATAYFGFPPGDFYSADYFSLFPWLFLFAAGYFACRLWRKSGKMHCLEQGRIAAVEWLGRHSLAIYILHQPVLYLMLAIAL